MQRLVRTRLHHPPSRRCQRILRAYFALGTGLDSAERTQPRCALRFTSNSLAIRSWPFTHVALNPYPSQLLFANGLIRAGSARVISRFPYWCVL